MGKRQAYDQRARAGDELIADECFDRNPPAKEQETS